MAKIRVFAQKSEARLCTLLVGSIQLYWSILPIIGGDWRLLRVLSHFDKIDQWFAVMGSLGLLLMITAYIPWRSGRQISLILSGSSWFGYFGMWVNYWSETERWLVSPVFVTAPLLGFFCLVLFTNDVMQKHKPKERGE